MVDDNIKMATRSFYGVAILPKELFDRLDQSMFITGCSDTVKFMCANSEEEEHLNSLGINTVCCDWYKLEVINGTN